MLLNRLRPHRAREVIWRVAFLVIFLFLSSELLGHSVFFRSTKSTLFTVSDPINEEPSHTVHTAPSGRVLVTGGGGNIGTLLPIVY